MKSVAIHQPNYIPWLGFFYKIFQSDIFVFLDDVQFSNEGMHNYHYIKAKKGSVRLKIPVIQTLGDKIYEVKVRDDVDWRKKHLDQLKVNYCQADYFEEVYSDFALLINESFEYLPDLNISIIKFICDKLGIRYNFIMSSDLKINSSKEAKIIDICKALGCEEYYSGIGARSYQNEKDFTKNGIQLKYSEFKIFQYPQQFSGFQSNVTILDFLMNCGYRWNIVLDNQV